MPSDDLTARVARQPIKVECPICRHRQWVVAIEERCDQCGSEIKLYEDLEAARRSIDALAQEGRVAYLREVAGGLHAVIANRTFRKKSGE